MSELLFTIKLRASNHHFLFYVIFATLSVLLVPSTVSSKSISNQTKFITAISGSGSLLLTKTGSYIDSDVDGFVSIGDSIEYCFNVTNDGMSVIDSVIIIDPLVGGLFDGYAFTGAFTRSGSMIKTGTSYFNGNPIYSGSGSPLFMPGDMGSMKVKYALTSQDISNGYIYNIARASGSTTLDRMPVSDSRSIFTYLPGFAPISLEDPCNCEDPLNFESNNFKFFHERIVINSLTGLTWILDDVGSSGIYNSLGIPAGVMTLIETTPGIFTVDVWVKKGESYTIRAISSTNNSLQINGLCIDECNICDSDIPSPSLSCFGDINLILNQNCEAVYNPIELSDINGVNLITEFFKKEDNTPLGDVLDKSHLGMEIIYNAIDTCTGRSCWGNVLLELKRTPETKMSRVNVMCGEDYPDLPSLAEIYAELNGECTLPVTNLREYIRVVGEKCDTTYSLRTVFGDVVIGTSKQSYTIRIDTIAELPIRLDMVTCPQGGGSEEIPVELECSVLEEYPTPAVIEKLLGVAAAYPHVYKGEQMVPVIDSREVITETPGIRIVIIDGFEVEVEVILKDTVTLYDTTYRTEAIYLPIKEGQNCDLSVKYVDETYDNCTGLENKIRRTWVIINWCTGAKKECVQWISIVDKTPPVIKPIDDIEVGASPWTCLAELKLEASATDNCSNVSFSWEPTFGTVNESGILSGLTLVQGPNLVTVTATDECGNASTETFTVTVVDRVAPVAIVKDQVNETIVPDGLDGGTAKVTVDQIDAGSHDSGCGKVTTCLLLPEELDNPIIDPNTNKQAVDSKGNLLYHPSQCIYDGLYPLRRIEGKDTLTTDIPYVICKDYVKFCCDDIGLQEVVLVVKDGSPHSPDGYGYSTVNIENKLAPIVTCPNPITVKCGDQYEIPRPQVIDGPCNTEQLEYTLLEDVDGCGEGRIEVIWTFNGKVLCRSYIIVTNDEAFDPLTIKWPLHYTGETVEAVQRECDVIGKDNNGNNIYDIKESESSIAMPGALSCTGDITDEPIWCDSHCSLIAMSHQDVESEAGDACKKIIRKWTLIDWCNYKPNSGGTPDDSNDGSEVFEAVDDKWLPADGPCKECDKYSGERPLQYYRYKTFDKDGYYTYDQVIKIIDKTPPSILTEDEFEVNIVKGATSKDDDFDDCRGSDMVTARVTDLCEDAEVDASSIQWTIRTVNAAGNLIAGPKVVRGASATMTTGVGGINDVHFIRWQAVDACGNRASFETKVTFLDRKKPVPVCKTTLSTATMSTDGTATIWAEDYNHGSYDNCSAVKVYFKDENEDPTPSVTFDCEDIPSGISTTKDLQLYVADEAGNEEYCYVRIRLDDSSDVCPDIELGAALIAGELRTESGDKIEKAEVKLSAGRVEVTAVDGKYAFEDIATENNYEIKGLKNDNPLNGVSTLDLVMIQRHILAIRLLDSPYKVIAADVNSDQRVSAIDLIELRQLILGVIPEFRKNTSWRFIDADQTFVQIQRPWPFMEQLNIDPLISDMTSEDFIGIKIGDVSGNAIANSLVKSKGRSSSIVQLSAEDQILRKGELIAIDISADYLEEITAMQWTFKTNEGVSLIKIEPSQLAIGKENYAKLSDDITTVAWHSPTALEASGELFTIYLVSTRDMKLSEAIEINSFITSAAVYTSDDEEHALELVFNTDETLKIANTLVLEQNTPNPFNKQTQISYSIAREGNVHLNVMDVTGRIIFSYSEYQERGKHTFTFKKDDLNAKGIFYYQVEINGEKQIRKMLLIE